MMNWLQSDALDIKMNYISGKGTSPFTCDSRDCL